MDLYRKRRLYAVMAAFIIIMLLVVFVRCCISGDGKKDNGENDANNGITTAELLYPNIQISQSTTSVTKRDVEKFSELDNLGLISAEFVPDDISLMNPDYLDNIVVVGDSIAKGYSVYGRLAENNVLAVGSIGARNVLETQFDYNGKSMLVTDILKEKTPRFLFVSLGMNDVNILSEEDYTDTYKKNIKEMLKVTPDSKVIVMSITPIAGTTDFTQNDRIDKYNEALRKMVFEMKNESVFYIDASKYLKNSNNELKSDFSSGDGIHLSGVAYDYLLSYMLTLLDWI